MATNGMKAQKAATLWLCPQSRSQCPALLGLAAVVILTVTLLQVVITGMEVKDITLSLVRQVADFSVPVKELEDALVQTRAAYAPPPGSAGCPGRMPFPYRNDEGAYLNTCCSEPVSCFGGPLSTSRAQECCAGDFVVMPRTYRYAQPAVDTACEEYDWWQLLEGRTGTLWELMLAAARAYREKHPDKKGFPDTWSGKDPKLQGAGVETARDYVKSDRHQSGLRQLQTARKFGALAPDARLLELGCGAMHAGEHFLPYLQQNGYVCVEPNDILHKQAANDHPLLAGNITEKRAVFASRDDFDPRPAVGEDFKFDRSWSHSILSHAADWQVMQYFEVMRAVLKPEGMGMASIRFSDGDGKEQAPTHDTSWIYPGVSFFDFGEVRCMGRRAGLEVELVPEARLYVTQVCPAEYHDWIRMRPMHNGS